MSDPNKKPAINPAIIVCVVLAGAALGNITFLVSQAITLNSKVARLGYQLDRIERTLKDLDK